MPEVHDRVLDILLQWQIETKDQNRFFYLRRRKDERFKDGYWFPGDEDYLVVSFWSGSDNKNKTPNAFLEIHRKSGCSAVLTASDSEVKQSIFREWVGETNQSRKLGGYLKKGRKEGQWRKGIDLHFGDFEHCLHYYLRTDKPLIDYLIQERSEPVGDEFESIFGFIQEKTFYEYFSAVQQQREQVFLKRVRATGTQQAVAEARAIRLAQLVARNFYDLKDIELLDLPQDASWIFLTGENAVGKTLFLRALALALSNQRIFDKYKLDGSWLRGDIWLNGKRRVITRTSVELAADAGTLQMLDGLDGYFAAYGPSRLIAQAPDAQNRNIERETEIDSLFVPAGTPLKSFDYEFLQAWGFDDDAKRERFHLLEKSLVTATAGRIQRVSIVIENGKGEVRYHEDYNELGTNATQSLPNDKGTSFDQLATGLRSILNLVADIYVRLSGAQDNRPPNELVGIVIIDELENHLHPKLQKALPQTLSAVFPKVQFIASTHSPIPFLGAPKDTVFIKISRDQHKRIVAERLELTVDFTTLLPNALLSSPIFGFDALESVSHTPGQPVRVENSYQQVEYNDELQKELSEYLTDAKTRELLALFQNVRNAD
jgi:hypothetical protein